MWKPVITGSIKAASALAIQSVRPLREYFSQISPPPPDPLAPKTTISQTFLHQTWPQPRLQERGHQSPMESFHPGVLQLPQQTNSTHAGQVSDGPINLFHNHLFNTICLLLVPPFNSSLVLTNYLGFLLLGGSVSDRGSPLASLADWKWIGV
jgi:hypothetical protein